MARVIPVLSRRELERASTGEAFLAFVEVTHPEITDEINLVVDGYDYDWNGKTWYKSYFELQLLSDDDSPPEASFSFPNVNRAAIAKLRNVITPCRVSFHIVAASYFDQTVGELDPRPVRPGYTVEPVYSATSLFLTEIKADQIMVEGRLRSWDYRQETWPDKRVTKALLPGIYAR